MKKIGQWAIPVATALLPLVAFGKKSLINPSATLTGDPVTLSNVEEIITEIASFLIVVSIIIAVIFIIYGGVRWMAARDDEKAVENAKKMIKNGVIGALVVLGVGVILNTLAGLISRSFFGGYGGL
jgi:uncharacterized membrane protein